jgi:hypothetical protein
VHRTLTVALLTGLAMTGAGATTASAEAAPPGINAVQCQQAGGRVITVVGWRVCVGGSSNGQAVHP